MQLPAIAVLSDGPTSAEIAEMLSVRGFKVELAEKPEQSPRTGILVVAAPSLHGESAAILEHWGVPIIVYGEGANPQTLLELVSANTASHAVTDDELELAILRILRKQELVDEISRLQATAETAKFEELIGSSEPMRQLFDDIARAAGSRSNVLVTGESGTGKELIAKALHRRSQDPGSPFVAVNCSAIPETLIESELFGHKKGAFTDAKSDRQGLLQKAGNGTVFLDEIGELPMHLQPKLLRTLQERAIKPVGGDEEVPLQARIVTATNINLEQAIQDKTFRQDLFYRINVIHLEVPPLRDRPGDILLLANYFLARFAQLADKDLGAMSREVCDALMQYTWPGNVRELQNCIERAVAMARSDTIIMEDLPANIRNYKRSHVLVVNTDPLELEPLAEVERRYILRVMDAVSGNKKKAAEILGLDRKTLYRKLSKYGYSS